MGLTRLCFLEADMGVVVSQDSEYAKEVRKWDAPKREGGMNANGYEPYPRMLYKAQEKPNGKIMCCDPTDEQFSAGCQRIVRSADEEDRARKDGWRESPAAALEYYEAEQRRIGDAAAEAAFAATKMSEKAQTERKGREAATHKHVPE